MKTLILPALTTLAAVLFFAAGAAGQQDRFVGWRGNWTGRFPEADPPVVWNRTSKSPVNQLLYSAKKPKGDDTAGAFAPSSQAIVNWLIAGPFTPKDPARALDEEFIDEAALSPEEGDQAADKTWTAYTRKSVEEIAAERMGGKAADGERGAPMNYRDGVDFHDILDKEAFKALKSAVAYAHVYLYSPRDGDVALILNHVGGLKIRLNGRPVYSSAKPVWSYCVNHWQYLNFGWHSEPSEKNPAIQTPATVNLALKKGWNRLLFKLAFGSAMMGPQMCMDFKLTAPAGAGYEDKNILWATRLPSRGVSGPIIVGDKVFITMELDELVCLDRKTGSILWRRSNTFYDATPAQERDKNPLFQQVEPLNAKITQTKEIMETLALHKEIQALLTQIDPKKYAWGDVWSGPFAGNATPTPCSDGKRVYACFSVSGVVACYDLDGNRKWILISGDKECRRDYNTQSPLLIGNVLFTTRAGEGTAYDKETGKVLWSIPVEDPRNTDCITPVPATLNGVDLIVGAGRHDRVLRASDGKDLGSIVDSDHATPIFAEGNRVFRIPTVYKDLFGQRISLEGGAFKCENLFRCPTPLEGFSIDSPLYEGGIVYTVNFHGGVTAWEVKDSGASVAFSSPRLDGTHTLFQFRNHILGATASPMLGGKHIYIMDNQGTTVVLEPGNKLKVAAVNKIESYLSRRWVTATQEETNTSPICDGKQLFIRGEETLYCIANTPQP